MKEQNTEYIVNLTKQVVGKEEDIRQMRAHCADQLSFFSFVRHVCGEKVRKMSIMTVGRICGYGLAPHQLPQSKDGFIRKTSLWETFPEQLKPELLESSGRFLLEQVAAATIASVANDIIGQNEYACRVHGSIEHMQSATGLCPGCGKP